MRGQGTAVDTDDEIITMMRSLGGPNLLGKELLQGGNPELTVKNGRLGILILGPCVSSYTNVHVNRNFIEA